MNKLHEYFSIYSRNRGDEEFTHVEDLESILGIGPIENKFYDIKNAEIVCWSVKTLCNDVNKEYAVMMAPDCQPSKDMQEEKFDQVERPKHYNSHPSGVECIEITEHYGFNTGNAIKYLWREGLKHETGIMDLKKAAWYINREIMKREKDGEK